MDADQEKVWDILNNREQKDAELYRAITAYFDSDQFVKWKETIKEQYVTTGSRSL